MKLTLCCIGKMRGCPEAALVEDYIERARRLGRGLGCTGPDLSECEAPRSRDGAARKARESALLAEASSAAARRIALDERGEPISSEELARRIARWRDDGAAEIAFLIGGADGHERALVEKCDLAVSFGRATFPHMLVRVMLVEQIYRAMTILSGHPYHRG